MTEGRAVRGFLRQAYRSGLLYPAAVIASYYGLLLLWRAFAYQFSFPELAAAALAFMLLPAVLAPGAMVRGLAAAALGALFSTVGIHTITGEPRYVFDQPSLWEGLPRLAVLLGLFAVPFAVSLVWQARESNGSTLTIRGLALVAGIAIAVLTIWLGARHLQEPALPIIAAFGGIGLLLHAFGWPRLPLFVGVVVGTLTEGQYLSALNVVSNQIELLTRPIVFALAVVILAIAVASYLIANPKQTAVLEESTQQSPATAALRWRNVVPLLGMATGVAFFRGSLSFEDLDTWLFPRLAGTVVIALCLLQLLMNLRAPKSLNADGVGHDMRTGRTLISTVTYVAFGFLGIVTFAFTAAFLAAAFHMRNVEDRGRNVVGQALSRLTLPSAREAVLPLGIGIAISAVLTVAVGVEWGIAALAGMLPFLLLRDLRTRPDAGAVGAAFTGLALIALARWSSDVPAIYLHITSEAGPPLVGLSSWIEVVGVVVGLASYTLLNGTTAFEFSILFGPPLGLLSHLFGILFLAHAVGVALLSLSLALSVVRPASSDRENQALRVLVSWQTLTSITLMAITLEAVHTMVA